MVTNVYGPVINSRKGKFWKDLADIRGHWICLGALEETSMRSIALRKGKENFWKTGNDIIDKHALVDLTLVENDYAWARG